MQTVRFQDVMYVVTTEAFGTISVQNARTPRWVRARMCMYSGCTCAHNACPINRIFIVTYAHYMFVFLILILMMHS